MFGLTNVQLTTRVLVTAGLMLTLAGCGSLFAYPVSSDTPTDAPAASPADLVAAPAVNGGVSPFGLPFAAGTSIEIAQGPHAVNYRSVPGFTFSGASDTAASLDFATRSAGVAIHPVAAGRVLEAWPQCNVVVVDHGGGVWAEYVHVQPSVSNGRSVTRDTVLGSVLGAYDHRNTNCGDFSSGPHLHFAFINGGGSTGSYTPIAGKTLCGRNVDGSGGLAGLGSVGGAWFNVPDCNAPGQTVTPAPVTPAPVTPAPPVSRITSPPAPPAQSSCAAPTLVGPGSGSSLDHGTDVSLSWSTNCAATYAELTGDPYGTMSFGGWQSTNGVHIGQMWSGTYSWHVKGKTSSGAETGWSAVWSFTVREADQAPAPIVTAPPAPIITAPPAPIITAPPTPCPFKDGGNGVTFYTGSNFTGQSWTWYVPAGHNDTYSALPSGLYQNLGSFFVPNNSWHVVLYQGDNGTGNLGHYDAGWSNVDSYWRTTKSVKIYINRTC